MHKTEAREKAKALKKEAQELNRRAKAAMKVTETLPEAGEKARKLKIQADTLKTEAEKLKEAARLEDLSIWEQRKVKDSKNGAKTYTYFMASWREGGKTRNVYLGSTQKISRELAQEKARVMKKEALGLSSLNSPESGY